MLAWNLVATVPVQPPLTAPVGPNPLLFYGGGAAGVIFILLVVVVLTRGRKKGKDPESGLTEDLSTYPPAPATQGGQQLTVMNQPARLRLVVVAPMGRREIPEAEPLLEQVLRGLGQVAGADKPRVKVWPPQLSASGFAPTFFRHTHKPDAEGNPSRWVLLAGPARVGNQPILLGMALYLDNPSKLGPLTLEELQWGEVLRVNR